MNRTGDGRAWRALALALAFPVAAQAAPIVRAELSSDVAAVGEEVLYTVTVTGSAGGELSLPRFGDLSVEGPSSQSQTSFSIVNGRQTITTSQTYTWYVKALQEGEFVIGEAKLTHNGETYATRRVTLTVEAARQRPSASARPQQQQPRQQNPFGAGWDDLLDPFEAFDRLGGFGTASADPWGRRGGGDRDVFLKAFVDKSEAHLGEQITLSLYLFSQAPVTAVQAMSFPKLDGFWSEDIEAPTQLTAEQRTIKGVPYSAYLLRRKALFALRAGDLVVDPVEAQVNLGMAMFFGAQQETVKRRSTPLKLSVKPLPANGQPPRFEAANVGRFKLSAEASPGSVPLGQPVQVKLVVEGTGNVRGLRVPKIQVPEGLKSFDPTVTDKVKISKARYGGTKTVEWVLIPERTGTFVLPPFELAYFDPSKGAYQVARTDELPLVVSAPPQGLPQATGTAPSAPQASNVLASGLRPVRLTVDLSARAEMPPWARPWFWPAVGAPVALWGLLLGGSAFAGTLRRRDPKKLKQKRARGAAARRLKTAADLLEQDRRGEFLAEIVRALQQFLADRCGVPALGLTRDELRRALAERGFVPRDVDELMRVLDTCETARYAPGTQAPEALRQLLDDSRRTLDALDAVRARTGVA